MVAVQASQASQRCPRHSGLKGPDYGVCQGHLKSSGPRRGPVVVSCVSKACWGASGIEG